MSEMQGMTVRCRRYQRRLIVLDVLVRMIPDHKRTEFMWHQIQLERSLLKYKLKEAGWIWRGR